MNNPLTYETSGKPGTANSGVGHWWQQRFTALLLLLLSVWVLLSLFSLSALDRDTLIAWMQTGVHPLFLVALILVLARHSYLGTRVIVEDYAHRPSLRLALVAGLELVHLILGGVGLYAILKIALGLAT
jgi:succinate dehydrogenase / fumarate reductase membrane anchor subunit